MRVCLTRRVSTRHAYPTLPASDADDGLCTPCQLCLQRVHEGGARQAQVGPPPPQGKSVLLCGCYLRIILMAATPPPSTGEVQAGCFQLGQERQEPQERQVIGFSTFLLPHVLLYPPCTDSLTQKLALISQWAVCVRALCRRYRYMLRESPQRCVGVIVFAQDELESPDKEGDADGEESPVDHVRLVKH